MLAMTYLHYIAYLIFTLPEHFVSNKVTNVLVSSRSRLKCDATSRCIQSSVTVIISLCNIATRYRYFIVTLFL